MPDGVYEGEVALLIRPPRALVVAEFLTGSGDRLRVCPSPAARDLDAFQASLRRLLDLPIDVVLPAHGDPVLAEGRRRIADALASCG